MFYKSAAHSCNGKIKPTIYKPAAHGKIFTFAETRLHIRQGWYILFMKIWDILWWVAFVHVSELHLIVHGG